jgi:hypothetical protein
MGKRRPMNIADYIAIGVLSVLTLYRLRRHTCSCVSVPPYSSRVDKREDQQGDHGIPDPLARVAATTSRGRLALTRLSVRECGCDRLPMRYVDRH